MNPSTWHSVPSAGPGNTPFSRPVPREPMVPGGDKLQQCPQTAPPVILQKVAVLVWPPLPGTLCWPTGRGAEVGMTSRRPVGAHQVLQPEAWVKVRVLPSQSPNCPPLWCWPRPLGATWLLGQAPQTSRWLQMPAGPGPAAW